jgi:pilus assembly protein CpaE
VSASNTGKPAELRAVLIAPNRELAAQLCQTLPESRAFQVLADLKKYPNDQTLEIRLRQFQPEVVLVDVSSDAEAACTLIRRLSSMRPPVPAIGLDTASRPDMVMRVLKLGAREYLAAPFDPPEQRDAVAGIVRLRRTEPAADNDPGKVIAFASAKPGCGASTLACQTAFALGRMAHARVLLADLDLAAGTVAYYTARQSTGSFLDVLERAGQCDPAELAAPAPDHRGVDVLGAPASPSEMPFDPVRFRQALDLFRGRYGWTVLDLPAIFHRVSLLALASADRTFLVSTTELASLHLARKATHLLGQLGINRDRFEVIINQTSRREGIQGQELEKILGGPVRLLMPDDHARLHQAIALGEPVAPESGFGEAIEQLAGSVAGPARSEKRKVDFMLDAGPVFAGT